MSDENVTISVEQPSPPPPTTTEGTTHEMTVEELKALVKPVAVSNIEKALEGVGETSDTPKKARNFKSFYSREVQLLVEQHPASVTTRGIVRSLFNVCPTEEEMTSEKWINFLETVEFPAPKLAERVNSSRPRTSDEVYPISVEVNGTTDITQHGSEVWTASFVVRVPEDVVAEGEEAIQEYLEDCDNWPDDWKYNLDLGDIEYGDIQYGHSENDGAKYSNREVERAIEEYRDAHPEEDEERI